MGIRLSADRQANQIEKTLKHHSVTLRVHEVDVGPRWTVFHSIVPLGQTIGKVMRLAEEIAMALGVVACRVDRDGSFVNIKVPHNRPVDVWLLERADEVRKAGIATPFLGLDETGNPLYVKLDSDLVSHILIAGITGSGKTELSRAMIASCAMQAGVHDLGIVLIDPKRRGYVPFTGLPHLCREIADTVPAALNTLQWAVELMELRDREGTAYPRIAIYIDEMADLILKSADVVTLLTRLLQRGRQAGIHVVACTQKPIASVIGSLTKSNFPVRIVGNVASPEDAKVASGLKQTGAEKLQGRGDFLLVTGRGIVGFQGARVDEADILALVMRLRGGKPIPRAESLGSLAVEPDSWVDTPRSTGRPAREPTEEEVNAVWVFVNETGNWPSLRWIRKRFATRNDRAKRILATARAVRNESHARILDKA